MILIVDIFVPVGRILGRLMDEHPNTIWAYSVNIAGSLVGTWLFVLMSFLYQPPFAWFLVFGLLMLIFIVWTKKDRRINFLLVGSDPCGRLVRGYCPGRLEISLVTLPKADRQ